MKNIKSINLLKRKKEQSTSGSKVGKFLVFGSAILLIIFIVSYIFTFSMLSYLSLKSKDAEANIADLTNKVNQKKDIEALEVAIYTKITSVEDILANQLPYPSLVREIIGLPTNGIIAKSFTLSPTAALNIDVTASSSANLDSFVSLLEQKDEAENKYKAINTSPITRNKDGGYILSVGFNMVKDTFHD